VLQRELTSFVALMSVANPKSKLQPVMLAYENLLVHKIAQRGLQMSGDQLANAAMDDVEAMIADPFKFGFFLLRIVLFEACSAFTRVAACTLALPPIRDTLSEGFSYFVTSIAAPVASGWSVRDLHPLESAALSRRTPMSDIG
jgi:hypothetical protein